MSTSDADVPCVTTSAAVRQASQPPSGDQTMTDKQINLKLPDDLWLAAKVKAAQNRVSLSEAIRVLLREWVG